jgi:hypothetical protein
MRSGPQPVLVGFPENPSPEPAKRRKAGRPARPPSGGANPSLTPSPDVASRPGRAGKGSQRLR